MKYKGIEIIQTKNKNLLLKLPNGGQIIVDYKEFANDELMKKTVDEFLAKNPNLFNDED